MLYGGLLDVHYRKCTLSRVRFPVWNNMFNWEAFAKVFVMLAITIFVISSIVVALVAIGALIHPFVAIILPIIGVIAIIAIISAYEHP